MKTKILLFIGIVALLTLSFTFSTNNSSQNTTTEIESSTTESKQIVGFISDEVVK